MKIYRYEKLEINPDRDQTVEDLRQIIEKTQDLELDSIEVLDNKRAFNFTVKREVELYPDTIK